MSGKHVPLLLAAALLTACSFVPGYERPSVDTPQAWHGAQAVKSAQTVADWWKAFESPELNQFMAIALVQNHDLRAALHRIEQARATLKIAGASLLPDIDASGDASRTRTDPPGASTTLKNAWGLGVDISYELDLFGANRAAQESAAADYAGSKFDRDALALVVMGEVAQTYFTVLNLRERLGIAQKNLKIEREILDIVKARYETGVDSTLDMARQRASLANNEASLATLESKVTAAENALALLLGQPPQSIKVLEDRLTKMTVPAVAAGQPVELLERRPDIRSAESALIAANADIGAARAAFFPSLNIGAAITTAADPGSGPATSVMALTSALTAPIFKGGALKGGVEKATARQAELVEDYRKTVLTSFKEVEDALSAVKSTGKREKALGTAVAETRTAYKLSREQYEAGAIDFEALLQSQRGLLQAEDSLAQTRLERLSAAIDLYKALGGGWEESP